MNKKRSTAIASLGEFGLIDRLTQHLGKRNNTTLMAAGDDAAVIDLGDEALLLSTDMLTDQKGAICGAALTERAIEMVQYIAERSGHNYPIIGSGGMMQPEDIKAMLEAGA